MYKELAPICLFTYNRLGETKTTIQSLQLNFLAKDSVLYVFSDGWKKENVKNEVLEVREYLKTIKGFKEIHIIESDSNKGLAKSIITGVSMVIEKHSSVIVLEDDLITSPNFLDFMNQALKFYKDNAKIFSISGYTMSLPALANYDKDYYLGVRASSWGWATWRRSWFDIDWEIKDYQSFLINKKEQKAFNLGGSDMVKMLGSQMSGKIDSWAIRWCYNQFKRNQYTIFPTVSKIQSIGFSKQATHTKNGKRFYTVLDKTGRNKFSFDEEPTVNKKLIKQFKNKFSLISRIKNRLGI